MPTLAEQLLTEETRPQLVADCCALLDAEVGRKKGVSGLALKGAYKTVKTFKRGFVTSVVDFLLDDWVGKLEPIYAGWLTESASETFDVRVSGQRDVVAERLLEVTDERALKTKYKTIQKLYRRLRPNAKGHVAEAVPALARLVVKHLA